MAEETTILADSISNVHYLRQLDLMAAERMRKLELANLLVYVIDTVPRDALEPLAAQFDVLAEKGMAMVRTDDEKRELIRSAIELHRYNGTPWAVKQALQKMGFTGVKILEHIGGHWAKFGVILRHEDGFNEEIYKKVVEAINSYKSYRSHLESISFGYDFTDSMGLNDVLSVWDSKQMENQIGIGGLVQHNGLRLRNGTVQYNRDNDLLTINIIYA